MSLLTSGTKRLQVGGLNTSEVMDTETDIIQCIPEPVNATEIGEETKIGSPSTSMEEDTHPITSLQSAMLDHLANSKVACFKDQQRGEPELSFEQKRQIAEDILKHNPGQFLARFGKFLQAQHLDYFTELNAVSQNYEIIFHLKQLQRFHCKGTHEVDVRNRRFEALKKLVEEGIYFSDKEMRLRNPLLYQRLIGQYLTEKEREERNVADRPDVSSWVNWMMAQIDRSHLLARMQQQKDDESGAIEEMDTSDEDEEEENDIDDEEEEEEEDYDDEREDLEKESGSYMSSTKKRKQLSDKEKDFLREQFVHDMYCSFLEGKDEDFDYSNVDFNPEYECLVQQSQDEEDKYFDSETPELVASDHASDEEEDELDAYMKSLKPDDTPSNLAVNLSTVL